MLAGTPAPWDKYLQSGKIAALVSVFAWNELPFYQ